MAFIFQTVVPDPPGVHNARARPPPGISQKICARGSGFHKKIGPDPHGARGGGMVNHTIEGYIKVCKRIPQQTNFIYKPKAKPYNSLYRTK